MNNDIVPVLPPEPEEQGTLRARDTRKDHIESLLHTLDTLIFVQLGILYLCDNLSFLLFLRVASQVLHVRQPETLQLSPVIFANLLCVGAHCLRRSSGTKYLHGGLIVDFVGELPPSKWRLVLVDLVVFGLQLLMLVVGREKLLASGSTLVQEDAEPQDIESEEAGRLRSRAPVQPSETEQGIEMQSLLPNGTTEDDGGQSSSKHAVEDADVIILDMRKGLRALFRRAPQPAAPTTMDNPAARAGFANMLARIAAARARAAAG
ncbi:hypothetical protein HRR83_004532 [Exophiala dermatitidis]|uniref:DUF1746 domain-containing protein n=2 Tax=Exophiala dermatitidis TaxID=5970 RepID=H6BQX7_EXODN|nr:uncharacterized protein HMPREF1120_02070 [Exophiala dermatitidis NIH/UT8656]KAJ4519444.1 hypothetical protein HRR74_004187 [Exophiala dermatitidis]EHY53890.1 hypothetical protein HMPREF1120_02070 [Exophiala dermatitidis NIH/UT8656]KAJ4529260.1 hypothetical protein HRR73_000282 [Exophiala dermatitidis]KAJ4544089.1 hypothetical protein HRR76_002159 [Exophiala dermatitidis]KAJ4549267.1 hypothetical protein HRR77_004138 [Exophiala dermatitidis]